MEAERSVGHVLEAELDLLARVRGEVHLLLDPHRRPAAAGDIGEAVAEVVAVRVVPRRGRRRERRPMRAAVGRHRDVPIVIVLLDLVPGPEREGRAGRGAQVDRARERAVQSVGPIRPPQRVSGMRIGREQLRLPSTVEVDRHRRTRQLDVARGVFVRARREGVAQRHAVLIRRARRRPKGQAAGVAVPRFGRRPDERVRRGEVREELLEAALPPRPEYGIEVSRGVDALRHEGVDEVVAARLLPCELEEQVGEPIVRLRLLELGPVVELRVRQGKERLRVQDRKTIRLLAQLRLTLVEPHR